MIGDPPVADLGKVAQHRHRAQAAGAAADQTERPARGDFADDVGGLDHRADIGVEVPLGLRGGRIAPAQREHLQAALDQMTDHAVRRPQIERVVFVDLRRKDQHWAAADGIGERRVLDELELGVAIDDRPLVSARSFPTT